MITNQKGQTGVEYIFMLAVVVSIITSLFSVIKTRYLGDISKCIQPGSEKLLLCKINALIAPNGEGIKKFQYYPFKK